MTIIELLIIIVLLALATANFAVVQSIAVFILGLVVLSAVCQAILNTLRRSGCY